MKTILNEVQALCHEIEKWPASEQQTKISVMAAVIAQKLQANQAGLESLDLAKSAIEYALTRVRDDENIRYHMGAFTEAFEQLKAAHCALTGVSEEDLEASIFGRELKRMPYAKQVDLIRDLLDNYDAHQEMLTEIPAKISAIIRR